MVVVIKRTLIGVGLASCVVFSGCERGTKRIELDDSVVRSAQNDVQRVELGEPFSDALITRVEVLRDREFRRRPRLVAEAVSRLAATSGEGVAAGGYRALEADRAAIFAGLMWGVGNGDLGGERVADLGSLARYDGEAVRYANGHADREMLRLAVVVALVEGLNAEYFEALDGAKSLDGALAYEASALGDAMFVASQLLLEESSEKVVGADELARFPEIALRNETLRKVLDGGFAAREGYALAAALYRAGGWSAIEVMKHAPPASSGDVVRPDRWFLGDDLGTWDWPGELSTGWDADVWDAHVQSGRVGPAMIAMWLGNTIDSASARTVYAGWRSDDYRFRSAKRSSGADGAGAVVFEWVSQWDTPHSASQVADAFRLVLDRQQAEREDGAVHVVIQKGVNVAVLVTDSDAEQFAEEMKRIDRVAVLSDAVVRYGEVQGLPFSFEPTRLEAFLVGARDARLEDEQFDDPGSGVEMDLSALKDDWSVQKTDETSVRWFARFGEGEGGALIQFTTELRDVLGPEFGTDAYRQKIEGVFATSLGVLKDGQNEENLSSVQARILEQDVGQFGAGRVLEIRGEGKISGKPRALWVRQFLMGDVLCTLSLQDVPGQLDAHVEVARAVFDGISFEPGEESAQSVGDGSIRIEVEAED